MTQSLSLIEAKVLYLVRNGQTGGNTSNSVFLSDLHELVEKGSISERQFQLGIRGLASKRYLSIVDYPWGLPGEKLVQLVDRS